MVQLVDFAVVTVFAREFLEGSIIVSQYRALIELEGFASLPQGVRAQDALRAVTLSALLATAVALLVLALVAIPLAVLSRSFDPFTAEIIEGASKMVASVSLLILSLKIPKLLGFYGKRSRRSISKKRAKWPRSRRRRTLHAVDDGRPEPDPEGNASAGEDRGVDDAASEAEIDESEEETDPNRQLSEEEGEARDEDGDGRSVLTLREIRFNVAWNLWREVAECGVFLIPFFMTGNGTSAIPLSAIIGGAIGIFGGYCLYVANRYYRRNRAGLCVFTSSLIAIFSAGLFSAACHIFEEQFGATRQVWKVSGGFWDADSLPMTLLTPFGYNDSRSVLEICSYWLWLGLAGLLHYRLYRAPLTPSIESFVVNGDASPQVEEDAENVDKTKLSMESTESRTLTDDAVECESSTDGSHAKRSFYVSTADIELPLPYVADETQRSVASLQLPRQALSRFDN
jgi:hypothetical protein